ncbi:HNH endonuclease [Brevundimonas bullata]|uniref:HNH endonuclease n=1 Tax=Brevundimonas bullata TaxID=13160 RepID=UPI002FDA1186
MRTRQCFERGGVGVVPLTRGLEAIVDLSELPAVRPFNWFASCSPSGHAYAQRSIVVKGKQTVILMHRVIAAAPAGLEVDHLNGNGLDNRRTNLRVCSHNDNMKNQVMHRINRIGLKGVWAEEGRFRAKIQHNGRTIHLGSFRTADEAAAAYRGAEKALGRALDAA